jgi:hypothetical protein
MSTCSDDDQGSSKRRQVTPSLGRKKKTNRTKCAAIDAIKKIEVIEPRSRILVHVEPGWESVLPKTKEEDPGCLIMWDDDNIAATVDNFNAAIVTAAPGAPVPVPPAWMNAAAGGPITIPGLKLAILHHVQTTSGGGGVVGNCLIAPNKVTQYGDVKTHFFGIGYDAFFVQNAVCPIGHHFVLMDRRSATGVADPIPAPPNGVRVFA